MEKHQTLSETYTENSDSQLTKENLIAAWEEKYYWMGKQQILVEINSFTLCCSK